MTLPDVDALTTYGDALNELFGVVDPTTDRPAVGANRAYCSIAGMTHTIPRVWVRFQTNTTTGGMNLVAWDAVWKTATSTAPVLARTSTGIFTITLPTSVSDEILISPNAAPGGSSHVINFRTCWANTEVSGGTLFFSSASPNAANVIGFCVYNTSFALTDAANETHTVFAI